MSALDLAWKNAPIATTTAVGDLLVVRFTATSPNAMLTAALAAADLQELEDEIAFAAVDLIASSKQNIADLEAGAWQGTPPMQSIELWRTWSHLRVESVASSLDSGGVVSVFVTLRVTANALPLVPLIIAGLAFVAGAVVALSIVNPLKDFAIAWSDTVKVFATAAPGSVPDKLADAIGTGSTALLVAGLVVLAVFVSSKIK